MGDIEDIAKKLGFAACGTARLHNTDRQTMRLYDNWIAEGRHAEMHYMANHRDIRENPRLLLPSAESIVVVAMNYSPRLRLPENEPQIADYALGKDYHNLLREKLRLLAKECAFQNYRICVDTAPLFERYWAVEAGLGWIGKNRQLIIPHAGSRFFLGEILVEETLPQSPRQKSRCGNCTRCLEACPTQALDGHTFDARRCLSFLTIENRGEIPEEFRQQMGNVFYGCDRCQNACPWNRFSQPTEEKSLLPSPELLAMRAADWHSLTEDKYRHLFKGSAVKRAKFCGIKRNLEAIRNPASDINNTVN